MSINFRMEKWQRSLIPRMSTGKWCMKNIRLESPPEYQVILFLHEDISTPKG